MSEHLFEKYMTERLSRGEAEELADALEAGRGTRAAFVEFAREWTLTADVAKNVRQLEREGAMGGPRPAPRRRSFVRWLIPVAAALIAIVWGAIRLHEQRTPAIAVLADVDAEVTVRDAEGRAGAGAVGTELRAGDRIETGAPADAGTRAARMVYVGTETAVDLYADTAVALHRAVLLERGRMRLTVANRPSSRPLAVLTPHAEIEVTGTVFSVSVSGDRTRVDVEEGQVRMKARASDLWHDVAAGQWGTARAGRPAIHVTGRDLVELNMTRVSPYREGTVMAGIAFDGFSLWVLDHSGETLHTVALDEERILTDVAVEEPFVPGSNLAWDGRLLWGVDREKESVLRGIDPASGRTAGTVTLPAGITFLPSSYGTGAPFDFGGGFLWVGSANELLKIDIATGAIVRRTALDVPEKAYVRTLVWSDGWIYAIVSRVEGIHKIRPADGAIVLSFNMAHKRAEPRLTRSATTALWIANCTNNQLKLISTDRDRGGDEEHAR